MLFNLDFAKNTVLWILSYCLKNTAQIFNPITEFVIPIWIQIKEDKAEIEIHPVAVEAKIRKCSMQFRVVQRLLCFLLTNSFCFTSSINNFLFCLIF